MIKTLLKNGCLFDPDGSFRPGALMVAGDRIERVIWGGQPPTNIEEAGVDTIDLGGRFLIPGFVDAHIHLRSLALKTFRCDLGAAGSLEEALELMVGWASGQDTPVLMGVDWDETRWPVRTRPTRDMLDELIPDRPLFMRRICGHVAVVNTAFQKVLEDHDIPVQPETGVIEEEAVWSANRLSNPEPDRITGSFRGAIAHLHSLGITGIHDIIEPTQFDNYCRGILASRLPLRIKGLLPVDPAKIRSFQGRAREVDADLRGRRGQSGGLFEVWGSKVFLDGSLGGWTAALNEPYADAETSGDMLLKNSKISDLLRAAWEVGCVCAIHAIGDRTVRTALRLLSEFPPGSRCFRMEHAEVTGPEELKLLARAPVDLVVQPNFVRNWGNPGGLNDTRLGPERWRYCNRFRTFSKAGQRYCFSSDGMPAGPLYGLKGATEHFNPDERVPPGEALLRYTRVPHEICNPAPEGGLLEPGQPADLALLSGDPTAADTDRITVLKTWVGGQKVHDTGLTKPL